MLRVAYSRLLRCWAISGRPTFPLITQFVRHCESVHHTMGYNRLETMMTLYYYYSIAIALHARRIQNKSAICDIKDEGGCKEASPFHSGCISTIVSVYKRRHGIQHESMLFTLWSKHDGKQFRLLVKRTVDLPSILGLSKMSSSGDMLKFANDTALVIQTNATLSRKSYGEALWTLTMPTTPNTFVINLIQLVLLLRTIRDVDGGQQYSIINRNCFWLVRMARLAICGCVRLDGSRSHDADELSVKQLVDKYETDYRAFMRNYHKGTFSGWISSLFNIY
ncbi:hypothetical protein F5887DRAFT_506149 [Amanita rubescens]|nr:hypothetical protein F5887DRAFT_506149 [Amanita rubescens]